MKKLLRESGRLAPPAARDPGGAAPGPVRETESIRSLRHGPGRAEADIILRRFGRGAQMTAVQVDSAHREEM